MRRSTCLSKSLLESPVRECRVYPASVSLNDDDIPADQVLEQEKVSKETVEVDRLQSHFDHYIHRLTQSLERQALLAAPRTKKSSGGKTFVAKSRYPYGIRGSSPVSTGNIPPSRHLGSIAVSATAIRKTSESPLQTGRSVFQPGQRAVLPAPISEDPNQYRAKQSWRDVARGHSETTESRRSDEERRKRMDDSLVFEDDEDEASLAVSGGGTALTREEEQIRAMRDYGGDINISGVEQSGFAGIEKLWDQPWASSRSVRYVANAPKRQA